MQRIGRYTVLLCHRVSVRRKTIKPDSIDDIIDIDLVATEQRSVDQDWDFFFFFLFAVDSFVITQSLYLLRF